MRWKDQELGSPDPATLPGLARLNNLVRSVRTPEFAGVTFHEILAKSALNHVPGSGAALHEWTINPYRGCQHACTYCFARSTHNYLDLDSGKDFDSEIIVKVNVAEILRKELNGSRRDIPAVSLGTNTDPYQRAEGKYALMPDIIEALASARKPLSILTKGTLLRRDIPLLAEVARDIPVSVAMSIAIYDDELQRSIEPGTPSTAARLATVRQVRDAGLECTVFLMPVMPYLTDTRDQLDHALSLIKEAGATSVLYSALHLRAGAKEWFMEWLRSAKPELVRPYTELYGNTAYAPVGYRKWLGSRMTALLQRHGLSRGLENPATGGLAMNVASLPVVRQPTLF